MAAIEDPRRISRVIGGTLLLLVGILFLLQNAGLAHAGRIGDWWPLLLVWIGLSRMLAPRRGHHFASGFVVLVLGIALQLDRLGMIGFHLHDVWPVLLVVAGLALVGESLFLRRDRSAIDGASPSGRGDVS